MSFACKDEWIHFPEDKIKNKYPWSPIVWLSAGCDGGLGHVDQIWHPWQSQTMNCPCLIYWKMCFWKQFNFIILELAS